jgi:hypothetical protein
VYARAVNGSKLVAISCLVDIVLIIVLVGLVALIVNDSPPEPVVALPTEIDTETVEPTSTENIMPKPSVSVTPTWRVLQNSVT